MRLVIAAGRAEWIARTAAARRRLDFRAATTGGSVRQTTHRSVRAASLRWKRRLPLELPKGRREDRRRLGRSINHLSLHDGTTDRPRRWSRPSRPLRQPGRPRQCIAHSQPWPGRNRAEVGLVSGLSAAPEGVRVRTSRRCWPRCAMIDAHARIRTRAASLSFSNTSVTTPSTLLVTYVGSGSGSGCRTITGESQFSDRRHPAIAMSGSPD